MRKPKAIQLVIKCIWGVLAVHSSDHYTAHHSSALAVGRGRIGILTRNFMNSEHSGILYCLTWAHELLLVRFGSLAAPRDGLSLYLGTAWLGTRYVQLYCLVLLHASASELASLRSYSHSTSTQYYCGIARMSRRSVRDIRHGTASSGW
eukprot:COSAG02_NODE_2678_length_8262_cov_5.072400_10_plen_149_part_00